MSNPQPLYTRDNCRFSCSLQWGLTVFWRQAEPDDGWFQQLAAATEPDGIRPLKHHFREPAISQFAISTQPHVSPLLVVQRVKGRLQYLVRHRRPKAFQGNYAIRSVGHVTRQGIEAYVADQLGHHRMADHVHLLLGCPIEIAPDELVLGFLNNLAFVQGMRPIYQFGGFVGTVGEYTTNAW